MIFEPEGTDEGGRPESGGGNPNPGNTSFGGESLEILRSLLEQSRRQTEILSEIRTGIDLDACLLEKIGRITCLTANEVHKQARHIAALESDVKALLELYRSVHPEQALQQERLARLQAELRVCCPPEEKEELICHYVPCQRHGGIELGSGFSAKSRGRVEPVPFDERPLRPWKIEPKIPHTSDKVLPPLRQGSLVGPIVPAKPTPQVLDFRSGPGTSGSGSQEPVTFRTFTKTGLTNTSWPPDMSGAKGGGVVLMSGNLWLKLSVDGGATFTDLDFTKIFAASATYGAWAGDQVVHYVPAIDCFVLYVQSSKGTGANASKNVVKVAVASPADLKKFSGGRNAWKRQWDFTSDTFALGSNWMDFPDVTYGNQFLYVNTNVFQTTTAASGATTSTFTGKLFFELPLANLQAGTGFTFQYALISDTTLTYGSPTQNIGDENYWAAHVDNSTLRIFSSKGTDTDYSWRDRKIRNWPQVTKGDIVSAAPDFSDWISEDHRIIGATRVVNQVWFAWTAGAGDGGAGGFKFPQPHIQIAKFDLGQDYKLVEQTQVWNADIAFAYPCLTTNSNNEVGISLAWGGGKDYGSHAVGILGDFVVWFGEESQVTSQRQVQATDAAGNLLTNPDGTPQLVPISRWGDYVHVRLAQPDSRFFSAFGYSVLKDSTATPPEKFDYLYVEFGRNAVAPSPIR